MREKLVRLHLWDCCYRKYTNYNYQHSVITFVFARGLYLSCAFVLPWFPRFHGFSVFRKLRFFINLRSAGYFLKPTNDKDLDFAYSMLPLTSVGVELFWRSAPDSRILTHPRMKSDSFAILGLKNSGFSCQNKI